MESYKASMKSNSLKQSFLKKHRTNSFIFLVGKILKNRFATCCNRTSLNHFSNEVVRYLTVQVRAYFNLMRDKTTQ